MNEKEMIEEMCKNFKCCVGCEMFNGYVDSNGELKNCSCAEHSDSHCTQCYISTSQAKVLYNANYLKIPEGSVVLTSEDMKKYAKDCIVGQETGLDIINALIAMAERYKEELKQARNETARAVISDFLKFARWTLEQASIYTADIFAIQEKYGIGVEE